MFLPYFSPQKETLTLTPGMGVGGGNLGPKHPKNLQKSQRILHTKIVHTSRHFSKNAKKNFKISSYIQQMTPNSIHAFKIIIHNRKKHQQYKNILQNMLENNKIEKTTNRSFIFYIYNFYNSYFV